MSRRQPGWGDSGYDLLMPIAMLVLVAGAIYGVASFIWEWVLRSLA